MIATENIKKWIFLMYVLACLLACECVRTPLEWLKFHYFKRWVLYFRHCFCICYFEDAIQCCEGKKDTSRTLIALILIHFSLHKTSASNRNSSKNRSIEHRMRNNWDDAMREQMKEKKRAWQRHKVGMTWKKKTIHRSSRARARTHAHSR